MIEKIAGIGLRALPTGYAVSTAVFLASLTPKLSLKLRDRELLKSAQVISFGRPRKRALVWGEGPLVILVHGWGGRAAQMATLAQRLAQSGFKAVAIDVRGHGDSPRCRVAFNHFADDTAELAQHLQEPVHGIVAHSAAGMSIMARRRHLGLVAEKYVCLCSPRVPYPLLQVLKAQLNVHSQMLEHLKPIYAEQLRMSWAELDRGDAYRIDEHEELMLVYDADDREIDPADGERIQNNVTRAQLLKTQGLGHNKVMWDAEVGEQICAFLARRQ